MSIEIAASALSISHADFKTREMKNSDPSVKGKAEMPDDIQLEQQEPIRALYHQPDSAASASSSKSITQQSTLSPLPKQIQELGVWLDFKADSFMFSSVNHPHAPEAVKDYVSEAMTHLGIIQLQLESHQTRAFKTGSAFPQEPVQDSLLSLNKKLNLLDVYSHVEQNNIRGTFGGKAKRTLAMFVDPFGETNKHRISMKRIKELKAKVATIRCLSQINIPECPSVVAAPQTIEQLQKTTQACRPYKKRTLAEKIIAVNNFSTQTEQLLNELKVNVTNNRSRVERGQAILPDGYFASKHNLNARLHDIQEAIESTRQEVRKEYGFRQVRQLKAKWGHSTEFAQLNTAVDELKLLYPNLKSVADLLNNPVELAPR